MPITSGKPTAGWELIKTHSTQRRLLKCDWRMHTLAGWWEKQWGDPSHQEEEDSADSDNPAAGTWNCKEEPVAQNNKAWEKAFAHGASSSVDKKSQKNTEATWDHYLHISPDTSRHMEAVFSHGEEIYGKPPGDPMEDLNVNLAIWWMFMNTTLRVAVHLGKDFEANLRYVKNHLWKTAGQLFRETEKLVSGQTETAGLSKINFQDLRVGIDKLVAQSSFSICHCQSPRLLSDSVLCLGKMGDDPVESWKSKIQWYSGQQLFQRFESNWWTIYGIRVERFSQGPTTMGILNQIQQMMGELQCEPENFTGKIIFMSMFNDIVWDAKGNDEICENNSKTIKQYARRFFRGHLSFLRPGSEKKWYGTFADKMLLSRIRSSSIPWYQCLGSTQNIELLLLRQSAQYLRSSSGYDGRITSWSESFGETQSTKSTGGKWTFLHNLLLQKRKPMKSDRETCCNNTSNDLKNCLKTRSYPDYAPKQVWHQLKLDNSCYALPSQREEGNQSTRCLEIKKEPRIKRWIQSNVRFGLVSDTKVCHHNGRYSIEVQFQSLFQDQTVSWIRIVNGVDKFVREAMPIQEEEKSSGEPAAKARPILKSSSISDANFIPFWKENMDWHWNTRIQWSLLFSSLEFHHSTTKTQSKSSSRRWWSSPLCPRYWWMQEEASGQYWKVVSWDEERLRQCSALVDWKMNISSGKKWTN